LSIVQWEIEIEMAGWIATLLNQLRCRLDHDPFWREQLDCVADADSAMAVHLAVFVEPYLQLILEGKKSIESRFSANHCAPYGVGICRRFYDLDFSTWKRFEEALGSNSASVI
jgi:hypothetical protein